MSNVLRAGMTMIEDSIHRYLPLIDGGGSPGSNARPGLPLPAIKKVATRNGPLLLMIVILSTGIARATDAVPATNTAPVGADKWQYTLFHPVPDDQLRDFDTDRPDKTNTPHTVDAGHLLLETGLVDYTYDHDRYYTADSRIETFGWVQANFRLGVTNTLEVNIACNVEQWLRDTDNVSHHSVRQNGIGDTTVGAKLNFWGNDPAKVDGDSDPPAWTTALGIQPQLKIPTARQSIGNGHAELTVGLPFLIILPGKVNLGLQPTLGWQRNSTNSGDATGWQNSISVDKVFFDRFDPYIEYWAYVSTERHVIAQQTFDVGLIVTITSNLTWDAGVNFGLNRASTQLECTSGLSVRF